MTDKYQQLVSFKKDEEFMGNNKLIKNNYIMNWSFIIVSHFSLFITGNYMTCKRQNYDIISVLEEIFFTRYGVDNTCLQWKCFFELLSLVCLSIGICCESRRLIKTYCRKYNNYVSDLLQQVITFFIFSSYITRMLICFLSTQFGILLTSFFFQSNFKPLINIIQNVKMSHLFLIFLSYMRSKKLFNLSSFS